MRPFRKTEGLISVFVKLVVLVAPLDLNFIYVPPPPPPFLDAVTYEKKIATILAHSWFIY